MAVAHELIRRAASGDLGRLYFWVGRKDAGRRDFSNVWMVLQCY